MRTPLLLLLAATLPLVTLSCENVDTNPLDHPDQGEVPATAPAVPLGEVAEIFSILPIGPEQLREVSDAVSASVANGYDEEYTMADLFTVPGAGVGDDRLETKAALRTYSRPLRDLLSECIRDRFATRGDDGTSADKYLELLTGSDLQVYWPYSDSWNGEEAPVITFDPEDGSSNNVGYKVSTDANGKRTVTKMVVTEDYAKQHPVWVINRNDDASYTSIELLRRQDPDWGSSGGNVVVKSSDSGDESKTLVLKSFKAYRNYDCWLRGGSEFFVKCGSIENFTAKNDAEMRQYSPSITDFMIEVRRNMVGISLPFNAVLVTDWTPQLEKCLFMITEDDGGAQTGWTASAVVKYNSKAYGIEITIPFNALDDIVWRGTLSSKYLQKKNVHGRFGDVEVLFDVLD
ncbi:MAG: hypothetical protein J6W74_03555 [Bacteroidales bacterium]|nr:hypothetical protein [Bacteroidales bacterium]